MRKRLSSKHKSWKIDKRQPPANRARKGIFPWIRRQRKKGNKHSYFKRFHRS